MEEMKPKNFSVNKPINLEAIGAVVSFIFAGLVGSSVPIWYLHTHLNSFFNTWFFGPIIFDLVVIVFGLIFIIAWGVIFTKLRKTILHFRERNEK